MKVETKVAPLKKGELEKHSSEQQGMAAVVASYPTDGYRR